jgi:hypothetical protein
MRDLKKNFPHLFSYFKPTKLYRGSTKFSYTLDQERVSYYDGASFKSVLLKEAMVGYPLSYFMRTKITGKSIHIRKKKKKK